MEKNSRMKLQIEITENYLDEFLRLLQQSIKEGKIKQITSIKEEKITDLSDAGLPRFLETEEEMSAALKRAHKEHKEGKTIRLEGVTSFKELAKKAL